MVNLNLFSWRNFLQIYQQRVVIKSLLTSILMTSLIIIFLHFFIIERVNKMNSHIQILQEEINLKTSKLSQPEEDEIKKMLAYGIYTQQFFTLLSIHTPDFCFTEVVRNKNRMTFIGQARSSLQLSDFLRNFRAAHLFTEIKVDAIDQIDNNVHFQFHAFENTKSK